MTDTQLTIPREALELWRFADKVGDRLSLSYLEIGRKDGRAISVATDGHQLGKYEWDAPGPDALWYLHYVNAKSLLQGTPAKSRNDSWSVEDGDEPIVRNAFTQAPLCSAEQLKEISDGCGFPGWHGILEYNQPEPAERFSVDLALLDNVRAWAKSCRLKPHVTVQLSGALGPLSVTVDKCDQALFVIMPMSL